MADISRTSPTTLPFETHLSLSNTYYPFPHRQRDGSSNDLEGPLVPRETEENLEEFDSVLLRSARPASRMAERTTRTAANLFSSGAKRPGISVDSAPRELLEEIRRYSTFLPRYSRHRARSNLGHALKFAAIAVPNFSTLHFMIHSCSCVVQVRDFDCSRSRCGCKLEERSYLPPPCRLANLWLVESGGDTLELWWGALLRTPIDFEQTISMLEIFVSRYLVELDSKRGLLN